MKFMKLGILEKLLPPDNKVFFDCFIDAALNCKQMAILFNEAVNDGVDEELLMKAKMLKHKGSDLERETLAKLNSTFVTPIDREDIQALAGLLNKINKKISQAFMNFNAYKIDKATDELIQQSRVILKATTELTRTVSLLKKLHKTKEITDSRNTMKEIESIGDDVLYRATSELFSGKYDAITVIKLRDIYKDLERALDRCYFVSDTVLSIALKNG